MTTTYFSIYLFFPSLTGFLPSLLFLILLLAYWVQISFYCARPGIDTQTYLLVSDNYTNYKIYTGNVTMILAPPVFYFILFLFYLKKEEAQERYLLYQIAHNIQR